MIPIKLVLFTLLCLSFNQSISAFTLSAHRPKSSQYVKNPTKARVSKHSNEQSINQSINQLNDQSIDQSINQLNEQSTDQYTRSDASIIHTFEWHLLYDDARLTELHQSISDPRSPKYRQFLDYESINQLITPEHHISQSVIDWLNESGVNNQSINIIDPSCLSITLPIQKIEDLFQIQMYEYHHSIYQSVTIHRTDSSIHLPDRLIDSVRLIHMINDLPPEAYTSTKFTNSRPIKQSDKISQNQPINQSVNRMMHDSLTEVYDPTAQSAPQSGLKSINQTIDQSINHRFHSMAVESQLQCTFTSGTHVTVTPQFIAQQYGFAPEDSIYASLNQSIPQSINESIISNSTFNTQANQSINQSIQVRVAVIGGALIADGPNGADGPSICEYYDVADLQMFASDINYSINQTIPQSTNQTSNSTTQSIAWRPRFIGSQWTSINDVDLSKSPNRGTPALEASLDISALFAFCPGCLIGLFPMPCDSMSFYSAFRSMRSLPPLDRPHIVSISYSYGSDISAPARDQTDMLFVQLGLMGVSIVVSSGDDGAVSNTNPTCTHQSINQGPLHPEWPASSPYVTSVGATDFLRGVTTQNAVSSGAFTSINHQNKICGDCRSGTGKYVCQTRSQGESAVALKDGSLLASDFTSGGGFSTYARRPQWQQIQVNRYLHTCTSFNQSINQSTNSTCRLPPSTWYDSQNRGYPDVSFYGGFFVIGYVGSLTTAVGTSLSSPAFSCVLARLAQHSININGQALGFVNPMLYAMDEDARLNSMQIPFTDIVRGDNICPRLGRTHINLTNCRKLCGGYESEQGWDPVSGLGSVNLKIMLAMLPTYLSNIPFQQGNETTSSSSSSSSTGMTSSTAMNDEVNGAIRRRVYDVMLVLMMMSSWVFM